MHLTFAITTLALALTLSLPAVAQTTWQGGASGSNGRSVAVSGAAKYDPATGRSRSSTVTTGNGASVTRSTTADCAANGDGTASCSRSTGMGNATRSAERSFGNGATSTTVTRRSGNTASRWISVTR